MDSRTRSELIERLNRDAERIASHFGLRYASIEAERGGVRRRYGVCYADGRIRIRLRHTRTGAPLKYSSLVNTLCHELAHLRHFHHRPVFHDFYRRLLEHARAVGIYQPGPIAGAARQAPRAYAPSPVISRGPEQLWLFVERGGGTAAGLSRSRPGRTPRGCSDPR
jgi:hypothetical protein